MERLLSVKQTQLAMAQDRGYNIDSERSILEMDSTQFETYLNELAQGNNSSIRTALSRIYEADSRIRASEKEANEAKVASRRLLVYYASKISSAKQVPLDVIRQFMKLIRDFTINEAILIIDAPLSSKANQALSEITNAHWQVFFDTDLTYNPARHCDTSAHRRLTETEKAAKLAAMKTDLSKLLIIKINDPIIRYYGWSPGDLIEVTRVDSGISVLTPKTINYRVVVASW